MSYYAGNIPPPEKSGMFPPGSYPPSAGTYLPAQSGLPPGPPQPGYPAMTQQYPGVQPYPPSGAYGSSQTGYPTSTLGAPPTGFQTMGFSSMPSMSNPSYPSTQGYPPNPPAAYPAAQVPTQSPYGSAPLPPSNPMYQSSAYGGLSMPGGAGRGYPGMPMYPSNYNNPYGGPSPYPGPPY